MRDDLVLDASVVAKWLSPSPEQQRDAALRVYHRYLAGEFRIFAPALLAIEILNVAARRWRLGAEAVAALVPHLDAFGFDVRNPSLARTVFWTSARLTAYDACYVALAEECDATLVTADARILGVAPDLTLALADF